MTRTAVGALSLILALCASGACDGKPRAAGPAAVVKAQKGQVLATNSLAVDFAAYKVTFIELGADRCIPCKEMQPIMKAIAAEFPEDVQVVFYDVWKDAAPARKYGIQLIPTQVFIGRDGKEIFRHVGLYPEDEILGMLKEKGIL
jgi:thiol-disulfide isomerase/thioredoxin